MADDDTAPLRTAALEAIVSGDFADAEALLRRAKGAARVGGNRRANHITLLLKQCVVVGLRSPRAGSNSSLRLLAA